ncbi:diacylglycerol/lipid kinase family protein [Streptomyces sp. NRRL B-24484]|uniref:diacylglycerol/lipid kinase family protein n=1 Tax=Streptomyces sp. NRRL B-24484 TaxID=1463833 RepID=UPI0004C02087|nr:diacylglycerol kinase family protein [Streptomyces sp. NRRL B-24484]
MTGSPDAFGYGDGARRRWAARLAFAAVASAAVVLLIVGGLKSLALMIAGLAALAVAVAGLWWALTHRGARRLLAIGLAVGAVAAVLVGYALVDLLWAVLLVLALWAVAVVAGRSALSRGTSKPAEHRTPPPSRPFLIMNPRSGGGKVERFGLAARARALGAEVVLLDPEHHQNVTELARAAVARGADLLGVAGGDGTQALVAGVAAEHGLPFLVISAGTRNHFAMDLGLDRTDPGTCLDALTDGVELHIDLGLIGDRVFVNNASFGTYAAVVQSPAYRDDKVRTVLDMLPELLTHQSGPRLRLRAAGAEVDAPQAVLVSNNPYAPGDAGGLGRRPRLDTGALGVLGVKVDTAAQAVGLLRGGTATGLTALAAREVVIDADVPEIPVGVDGEALVLPTPVVCRIRPAALRVRVPRHRPGVPSARPPLDWQRLRKIAFPPRDTAG